MERTTIMDATGLPSTAGEKHGFHIAPDLLWRQDPAQAVMTWTPDFLSPPISMILDPVLRETVAPHEQQSQAYVAASYGSPPATIPEGNAVYRSHDLLVLLKRIQGPLQGPDLHGIAHAIANMTSSVRAFYRLLTYIRWIRRDVHVYDRTFVEVLLSLALFRPVHFWNAHEIQQWQPWMLVDYAITAEATTAILTVTNGTVQRGCVYDLKDPMAACTMIFEPY